MSSTFWKNGNLCKDCEESYIDNHHLCHEARILLIGSDGRNPPLRDKNAMQMRLSRRPIIRLVSVCAFEMLREDMCLLKQHGFHCFVKWM
uniref:Uncharacterized protein n=1 Tax=Medicago truncatula TaxID=3880 RepID=Q2HTS4_MEDTR|nr:hypothetical protein MtrDRAFT_AC149801g14v2 [Medicago truncatula]